MPNRSRGKAEAMGGEAGRGRGAAESMPKRGVSRPKWKKSRGGQVRGKSLPRRGRRDAEAKRGRGDRRGGETKFVAEARLVEAMGGEAEARLRRG